MAYCGQATQGNADYLASKTGLSPAVALAWLRNECQSVANPTNPLNIRYYGSAGQTGRIGGFATYASPHAGLDAAAGLVNNSAYYTGIRAAIHAGNPYAQAHAIELSPWAGGHYGGTSTKYGNLVSTLKSVLGGTLPPLPSGGGTATGGGTPPGAVLASYKGPTLATALGHDVKLTSVAQIGQIASMLATKLNDPNGYNASSLAGYLVDFIGHNASDVPFNFPGVTGYDPSLNADKSAPSATDPITAVANAITGFGGAVGKVAGFMAGLVLIGFGVFIYGKSVRSKVENVA